jgi:glycine amidinotransferase
VSTQQATTYWPDGPALIQGDRPSDTEVRGTPQAPTRAPVAGPVNCWNEWDPLEEVIVGVADHAMVPPWHLTLAGTMPSAKHDFFREHGGTPFPDEVIAKANADLAEFADLLESEGVRVRRPEPVDHGKPFSTPDWTSPSGVYSAMPRDLMLVVGDEIIETPGAWRSRYFELQAYRPLLREYFEGGSRWTSAPKPELKDELYVTDYTVPSDDEPMRFCLTEVEPVFDAADFIRCGTDIFCSQSNVTNQAGITWLRRHLGSDFRIHEVDVDDTMPMHIDSTFMPIAPGKVIVNPERVRKLPDVMRHWDVLVPPRPTIPASHPLYMSSRWITMNLIMLDEHRVIVEENEAPLIQAFKEWGFLPIPCPFRWFNSLGGSFHCATLDIRRRGVLQSYM